MSQRFTLRIWGFFLFLTVAGWSLFAYGEQDAVSGHSPFLAAHRINSEIHIDGTLSEAGWQEAPVTGDFTQYEPEEGEEPSFRIEVSILYDESAIYVGARLYDDQPDRVIRMFTRRDDIAQVDYFWISLDSQRNQKTAYTFAVSASGVQADGIITNEHRSGRGESEQPFDTSWDGVWYSAVNLTSEGYVVEIEIPYSMLRFSEADRQTWGLNFHRNIARLSEIIEWAYIPRTTTDYVAHYGQLTNLISIQPQGNFQLIPYSLSKRIRGASPESPSGQFSLGSDIKIGLGSNITFDGTANPDFGQVESDPAVLNLTTFETIFPEKRPFFLEGANIFDFPFPGRDGELVYTRRIGVEESPIIGAMKLTGRTERNYTFGSLASLTGRDFHPDRLYLVGRLRRDLPRTSHIGGMLTAFTREENNRFQKRTITGGLDWQFQTPGRQYEFKGFTAFANQHFVQDTVTRDVERRHGWASHLNFGKIAGNLRYSGGMRIYTDEFNVNDVGHLRQNNLFRLTGHTRWFLNQNQPFRPFRRGDIGLFLFPSWAPSTFRYRGMNGFLFSNWTLKTFQTIEVNLDVDGLGGYDVRETRGLGPYKNPGQFSLSMEGSSDSRKRYQLGPEIDVRTYGNGGIRINGGIKGRWDLTPKMGVSGGINHTRSTGVEAWMANEPLLQDEDTWYIGPSNTPPDSVAPDLFRTFPDADRLDNILKVTRGIEHYVPVFGRRQSREFSLEIRGNVALSPVISLQLFNQLFVARGQYSEPGILTSPEKIHSFDAYPKRHDFALHSYIMNLVFRWEYYRGATLYLVWSQTRQSDQDSPLLDPSEPSPFNTSTLDQLSKTFSIYPNNVILLKIDFVFLL